MKLPAVHHLFDSAVDRFPHLPALRSTSARLTYAELSRRCDRLANYLIARGLSARPLVVLSEDSAELVTSLIASLKAGALFVPLDACSPAEYLSRQMAEVRPGLILSSPRRLALALRLAESVGHGCAVLSPRASSPAQWRDEGPAAEQARPGEPAPPGAGSPDESPPAYFEPCAAAGGIHSLRLLSDYDGFDDCSRPSLASDPDQPAYIYFTSGSTGRPKGVVGRLKSVAHFIDWECGALGLDESTRSAQLTHPCSDAFLRDALAALCSGGCLCVPPSRSLLLDGRSLGAWLAAQQVTLLHGVPSLWRTLLEAVPDGLPALRHVLLSGEPLLPADVRRWHDLFGERAQLVNLYGPTETTMTKFVYFVRPDDGSRRFIPVGRPMPGARAVLLDEAGKPCPPRVVGEICIRTPYASLGYLNDPEATQAAFVANPFGRDERDLIYKTGDYAQLLDSGDYQLLGRRDTQVKVRGVRIELGEVEAALLGDEAVEEAAVVDLEESAGGGRYLCAYLVLKGGGAAGCGLAGVQERLRGRLPAALVPTGWVQVCKLPRLASGKVDRKSLPPPQQAAGRPVGDEVGNQEGRDWKRIDEAPARVDYALSHAQKRLWVLDQLADEPAAYNIFMAYKLAGTINKEAFRAALRTLVSRHEILRTVFVSADGEPRQKIHSTDEIGFALRELDYQGAPRQEQRVEEYVRSEAVTPFDLSNGPLIRVTLIRLEETRHLFLLTMHHIVGDEWSTRVLLNEVLTLYSAYAAGRENPLAPLRIQYRDYAEWQGRLLEAERVREHRDYWLRQFEGELPALDLPTDFARPPVKTYRGHLLTRTLSPRVSSALRALAESERASLFMALLASVNVLLYRYTGQRDIIVGSPVATREHAELENQIGFYVNTLALRTLLDGGESFLTLLKRVRRTVLEAYEHRLYPFDRLVDDLQPERDLSRSPLFDVMVALHNIDIEINGWRGGGLSFERYDSRGEVSKFDLTFNFHEAGGELVVAVEYSTDLFTAARVGRVLDHYESLLTAILNEPAAPLRALDYIPAAEKRQLLELNPAPPPFPCDRTAIELFEESAARTPERVALVFRGRQFTYRELDGQADGLAHRLLETYGVRPKDLLGVMIDRSEVMVITLLAVLKAGAAYVPIDPQYPSGRIRYVVEDSQLRLLLSERTHQELWEGLPAPALCVHEELRSAGRGLSARPPVSTDAADLMYVIYTSGSTGRPKGVEVTHGAAANFLASMRRQPGINADDCLLAVTTCSFDISVLELFLPLTAGACVILADRTQAADAAQLLSLLQTARPTVMQATPSMWQMLLDNGWEGDPRLRALCGGEPLSRELGGRLLRKTGDLWNLYGPTETTVWSTLKRVGCEEDLGSVGAPIANTRVYILDEHLRPMPFGVAGEVCIGGAGVARGYRRRPALTAEKFTADALNPFSAGERLYRTGDVGRWLPDGTLELRGRRDQQVKVRGHRVEPGEVEDHLLGHPEVRAAAVMARKEGDGAHLVAYVVAGGALQTAELRAHLRGQLPEYMIPSYFVRLESLPLTPNGKLNRKSLPAPEDGPAGDGRQYVAARNPTEEKLVAMLEQLLGRNGIGVRDNFFEIGVHSIKATQIVSRVYQEFNLKLELRDVFMRPTVEALALSIVGASPAGAVPSEPGDELTRGAPPALAPVQFDGPAAEALRVGTSPRSLEEGRPTPPLVPAPREGALPLSFAQQRLWFLDQLRPGGDAYNIHAAVRLSGRLEAEVLRSCFDELFRRHEALRTTFAVSDEEPRQVIAPAQEAGLPLVDLRQLAPPAREAEARKLAREDARRPFDLTRGPLLRSVLLRLGEEEHVLSLTMHHIVSDMWSMGILVREMAALYASLSGGRPSPLAPLPIQYADYAVWQRGRLRGEVLESLLAYWRNQLGGAPELLELPTDRPRPKLQTASGAHLSATLPAGLAEALRGLSRRENVTLFTLLLTAFQILLFRYTNQRQILVGTPVANRTRTEVEGLIGFFANTLVVRTDIDAAQSFRALLGRVSETCLDAYAHQELPFEKLVEELRPVRDPGHSPLFQVMFALQHGASSPLSPPGLRLEAVDAPGETAKFDLSLQMGDAGRGGLSASFEYNTDLFDAQTIGRMLGHLETLLEGIAADPARSVGALPLLKEDERRRMLVEWNDTEAGRDEACLHELFERRVEQTPEAVALVFGDEALTFGELNRRANQLARYLRELGVGADVLVGLCMERSAEMIVGLLGVLKAGGAYVPLDPSYPRERIAFMLEDMRASVLLTRRRLRDRLPAHAAQVVCLDADWRAISTHGDTNLDPKATADNLAYVIYTSGSTGKPKGVQITHRGVCNLAAVSIERLGIGPETRTPQMAALSFDSSVVEIFPTLLAGGSLHLVPREVVVSGNDLADFLRRNVITLLITTPGLLDLIPAGEFPALRTILVGGESCSALTAERWSAGRRFLNAFAPTETTVYTTLTSNLAGRGGRVPPLGRAIPNAQVYVLNEQLQPVPVGVVGEIYIGGVGVARGYLRRPSLTAERFIPNPFGTAPGARLYRTGDMARHLPDGQLEFAGRVDGQVKVRGRRIELGEIEAALGEHPGVREACVRIREDAAGEKQLTAYVVPAGARGAAGQSQTPEAVTAQGLRRHAQAKLPSFMVPSHFVLLDVVPLTVHGKIDVDALPAPTAAHLANEAAFVAPQTPVQKQVAEIWRDVLRLERVGINDNFFDLGGHSLLATLVMSRLRQAFGLEIPLRWLFEQPTVANVAAAVENMQTTLVGDEHIAELLKRLDQLTEEEVQTLLTAEERALKQTVPDN